MAGTYQEGTSKVLSGVYTLIQAAVSAVETGGRGVIAYPFTSNWGPINTLDTVVRSDEFITKYNGAATALSAKLVYELAFPAKPQRLLTYRMATEAAKKGTATLPVAESGTAWVLETLYPSDRSFTAVVRDSLIGEGKIVEIIEGTTLLAKAEGETVEGIAERLNASAFVRVQVTGSDLPSTTAGVAFAGGNNGSEVTVLDYESFLTAILGNATANAFAFPGISDEAILTVAETWLRTAREEGFYVSFARGGTAAWDSDLSLANEKSQAINYRAIHNVGNGVDGYTAADMATFIAARVGSVELNRTLTDETTPFKQVNVPTAATPRERVKAKLAGTIVFVQKGDMVLIDEGVNTLTVPKEGEVVEFGKIRISNTLDHIAKDLEVFGEEYKKDKSNTPEARETYAATIENEYFRSLAGMSVLQPGYFYRPDPDYHGENAMHKPKLDEAFFHADMTPVDSMERVYQKLGVSF